MMDKYYQIKKYTKIQRIEKADPGLFNGRVEITEKVDGSNFSFAVIDGEFFASSRNMMVHPACMNKTMRRVYDAMHELYERDMFVENVIYRGEYISKPKHHEVKYGRIPKGYFILFGAELLTDHAHAPEGREYGRFEFVKWLADIAGLETVQLLFEGEIQSIDDVIAIANEAKPLLGGENVEGVVVKNLTDPFNPIMAKYVRPEFSENISKKIKDSTVGPSRASAHDIGLAYAVERRWQKAVETLTDDGVISGDPSDIPAIMRYLAKDIEEEEGDAIKNRLWRLFKRDVIRGATHDVPAWYKKKLLDNEK